MKGWDKAAAAVGQGDPWGKAGFFTTGVCAISALAGSYFASAGNFYVLPCVTIVFPMHRGALNIHQYIFLFCQIKSYLFCVCMSFKEDTSETTAFFFLICCEIFWKV